MKTKSLLLFFGAVTLAAGVALASRALMRPPPPVTIIKEVPMAQEPARRVLAATQALVPGDFINGSTLTWRELPAQDLRASHLLAAGDTERRQLERQFYGATLRRPVDESEPLTRDLLVQAGEPGFLAAVLAPGMRAVSIPTSAVASNAGLVSAGDWVDVILTLGRDATERSTGAGAGAGELPLTRLAAQTILRRVRVLALNSSTASISPPAAETPAEADGANGRAANSRANRSSPSPIAYESMTLEVSPAAAERLAVVREIGTLQIALRGVRDDSGADGNAADAPRRSVTRLADATDVLGAPSTSSARSTPVTVKTFQGATQGSLTFDNAP